MVSVFPYTAAAATSAPVTGYCDVWNPGGSPPRVQLHWFVLSEMPVAAPGSSATMVLVLSATPVAAAGGSATMVSVLSEIPVAAPGGSATVVLAVGGTPVATPGGSATVVLVLSETPVAAPSNAYCTRQRRPTHNHLASK